MTVDDGDTDDTRLLAAARAGDGEALDRLLQRYQPRVYRFGMRMCGNPADAEDVLQETLLAMARGLREFRGSASLSTWLFTIARRFCIRHRRRDRPAERAGATDAPAVGPQPIDPGRGPEDIVGDREIEAALARSIAALEPAQREVLLLRDVEGLTAPEVARVVHASVEAVKSRLHRARVALRGALAGELGAPAAARRTAEAAGCPDIPALFSRHLEGEIGADLCARLERHLEGCGRCRQTCDSLSEMISLCRRSATPRIPPRLEKTLRRRVLAAVGPGPR